MIAGEISPAIFYKILAEGCRSKGDRSMTFPVTIWLLFAAAMLISAIGFYKYVYFISLGYGFSIAGLGLLMLVLFHDSLSVGTILACVLFFVYGCRLGGYLLVRELKSAAYNQKMKMEIKDGKAMGFGVKCAIWITCALLYVLQVLAVYFRLLSGKGTDGWCIAGVCVMAFGVLFESAADWQKSQAKKKNLNDMLNISTCERFKHYNLIDTVQKFRLKMYLKHIYHITTSALQNFCREFLSIKGRRKVLLDNLRSHI